MAFRTLLVLDLHPRTLGVLFVKRERKDCKGLMVPKDEGGVNG